LIRKNPTNPIHAIDAINAMNLRPKRWTLDSRLVFTYSLSLTTYHIPHIPYPLSLTTYHIPLII
jgi:hypothetical protein